MRHRSRGGFERLLHRERRVQRAAGALEKREHRVAHHVDDAAAVRFDLAAEHRACLVERSHRGAGVGRHQPRVARDVRGQDRRQSLPETGIAHTTQAYVSVRRR